MKLLKFRGAPQQLYLSTRSQHEWIQPVGFDTGIKVYNCVARGNVPFIVRNKNFVTWYTCGPTVYNSAHIGHASCFVKLDIIKRILQREFSLNLITAMNITDIDDKIINRSIATKTPISDLVKFYEDEFWEDMRKLNVLRPQLVMRRGCLQGQ
uniref:tRNA synthetases class I catalytic domain-containing protein n=1 Tax=Photinus pyralis TaxID=7054 RepID=A0A1Y1NK07_PHOPY